MTQLSREFDPADAVSIGRIFAAHGVRGEIKVEPLTDFPERFEARKRVWLDGEPCRIERSRKQGTAFLLKLEGIDDRDAAEALGGKELTLPTPARINEPDRYYQHDIIGLRVEDAAGEALGKVEDILSTGANDVYVVKGERGELLLPAVEDVIKEVDLAGGRLVIELLPGLEFRDTRPRRRRPATK